MSNYMPARRRARSEHFITDMCVSAVHPGEGHQRPGLKLSEPSPARGVPAEHQVGSFAVKLHEAGRQNYSSTVPFGEKPLSTIVICIEIGLKAKDNVPFRPKSRFKSSC
jgi:hypothetical protein